MKRIKTQTNQPRVLLLKLETLRIVAAGVPPQTNGSTASTCTASIRECC